VEIALSLLDLRNEECPGPLVKTIRALTKARKGDKFIVLITSKECAEMLKQAIEALGIAKISVLNATNYYEIYLEKIVDSLEV
jgi:Predicted redox protein, regulator of disulfide bond formation